MQIYSLFRTLAQQLFLQYEFEHGVLNLIYLQSVSYSKYTHVGHPLKKTKNSLYKARSIVNFDVHTRSGNRRRQFGKSMVRNRFAWQMTNSNFLLQGIFPSKSVEIF